MVIISYLNMLWISQTFFFFHVFFRYSLTSLELEATMITLTWPRKRVLIWNEFGHCSATHKIIGIHFDLYDHFPLLQVKRLLQMQESHTPQLNKPVWDMSMVTQWPAKLKCWRLSSLFLYICNVKKKSLILQWITFFTLKYWWNEN